MQINLLAKSPKTKYIDEFLPIQSADYLFNYMNKLEGWKKNEYNGHKLARETIVFAVDEIVNNPDKFKIPEIWVKMLLFYHFLPN